MTDEIYYNEAFPTKASCRKWTGIDNQIDAEKLGAQDFPTSSTSEEDSTPTPVVIAAMLETERSSQSHSLCVQEQVNDIVMDGPPITIEDLTPPATYHELLAGCDTSLSQVTKQAALYEKLHRIGNIDVLRTLKSTINDLRSDRYSISRGWRSVIPENSVIPEYLRTCPPSVQKLWLLKEELGQTELNEQIFWMRKRMNLAEFFKTYDFAQADVLRVQDLSQRAELARERQENAPKPRHRSSRYKKLMINRFIDLLFLENASKQHNESVKALSVRWTRKTKSQTIKNWRKAGKPWARMIARFGKGILILLPEDLTDTE